MKLQPALIRFSISLLLLSDVSFAEGDRASAYREAGEAARETSGMQMLTCAAMMALTVASGGLAAPLAMQQCEQAEESGKAAEENEELAKKAAEEKPEGIKTEALKSPTPGADPNLLADIRAAGNAAPSDPLKLPDVPEVTPLVLPEDKPAVVEAKVETPLVAEVPASEVPGTIPTTRIGYDETGKSGAGFPSDRGLLFGGLAAVGKPVNAADEALRAKLGHERLQKLENRLVKEPKEAALGSSDGGGSASAPANTPEGGKFESILAAINGPPGAGAGSDQGDQILALSREPAAEEATSIFEYASYRYRRAARVEKVIKTKPRSVGERFSQAF